MDDEKYRLSKNRDEIIKVLKDKFKSSSEFIIWQKDPISGDRNFIIEAKFKNLKSADGSISVQISENDKRRFNHKLDTYFLLKDEDFVFKTKISSEQSKYIDQIIFCAPREIRLIELRSQPRVYFNESEARRINVRFKSKESEVFITAFCRVFNISQGGICIIITKETLSEINLQKEIILEGLSFFKPLENIKIAIVKNARIFAKKTIKADESFALGLQFQN